MQKENKRRLTIFAALASPSESYPWLQLAPGSRWFRRSPGSLSTQPSPTNDSSRPPHLLAMTSSLHDPAIDPTSSDFIVSSTGVLASQFAAAGGPLPSTLRPFPLPLPFLRHRRRPNPTASTPRSRSRSHTESSKGFLLDVAGPRVLHCADAAVDLIVRSGTTHHVKFESVDEIHI